MTDKMGENFAAILHGKNDLRFESAPDLGDLQAGMVRVQVKAMSICGSDVHLLKEVRQCSTAYILTAMYHGACIQ